MPIHPLPDSPSLENLKKQAKSLRKAAAANDGKALSRVGPYFGDPASITLQQAQLVLAREHDFSSWTGLKRHIEAGSPPGETIEQRATRFLDQVCLHYGYEQRGPANFERAAEMLAQHPEIADHSIHTAAAIGDADRVSRWLTETPSLVDAKGGPFHWPPLMYAAYARLPGKSTFRAGKALLDAGADPNTYYMWGGTYRFAVLTGVFGQGEGGPRRLPEHPEMVPFARALLDAGANPNDSQGGYNRCFQPDNTYLELMLEYGLKDSDPSDWWLTEADRKPEEHRTMHFQLVMALRWGFADRARLLIENGVDLNMPDENYYDTFTKGVTPYQAAMMRGLPEIADLIRDKGGLADPLSGPQMLQSASMAGDIHAARRLAPDHLAALADVQLEMFREAAGNGNLKAVEVMIDLGFDMNPIGETTPLHNAAFNGHIDVMKALIAGGADTTLRERNYHSAPMGHALHAEQPEAIALLKQQRMDIFMAAALGTPENIDAVLAERSDALALRFRDALSPDATPPDHGWAPPLWFAVVNQNRATARHLLTLGADPNVRDPAGQSLLDIARAAASAEIATDLEAALARTNQT